MDGKLCNPQKMGFCYVAQDENGNVIKVPVDKEFLLRSARAVFGNSSEEIIKKVEKLTF